MYPVWLEWEGLREKYEIQKSREDHIISESLPIGTKTVEIFRNDSYNISGIVKGKFEKYEELDVLKQKSSPLGTFVEPNNITISDISAHYSILGLMGNLTYAFDNKFEYRFSAYSVKREFDNSEKISWLTEWFLNGPNNPLVFSSSTEYELVKKYKRIRKISENYKHLSTDLKTNLTKDNTHFEKLDKWSVKSFNYSLIGYENEESETSYFIIHQVPDELGPEWSENIGIEFREEWKIPNDDERTKIREIVSFILGRQLLNIGHTKYDKNGNYIEDFVSDNDLPSAIDLKKLCNQSYDKTPIKINPLDPKTSLEHVLKQLIPPYLKNRDELKLNHMLWRYWLAMALNFESRLTLLSSGLELLFKYWYKSTKSKSKGVYLNKNIFDDVLENQFNSIGMILNGQKYSDRMIRRMQNAYQMGVNERIRNFFDEIQLDVGIVEEKALRIRNKPVHGSIFGSKESEELWKLTEAYIVLINRMILKILGFSGKYIDYYNPDYPERTLERPIIKYLNQGNDR